MNNRFDELAKGLARSVTRRSAIKKFATGLSGIALAWFGTEAARADNCKPPGAKCRQGSQCCSGVCRGDPTTKIGYCS